MVRQNSPGTASDFTSQFISLQGQRQLTHATLQQKDASPFNFSYPTARINSEVRSNLDKLEKVKNSVSRLNQNLKQNLTTLAIKHSDLKFSHHVHLSSGVILTCILIVSLIAVAWRFKKRADETTNQQISLRNIEAVRRHGTL